MGAPQKMAKATRVKFYAHMGRPGSRAKILRLCRRYRHRAIFAMPLHSNNFSLNSAVYVILLKIFHDLKQLIP